MVLPHPILTMQQQETEKAMLTRDPDVTGINILVILHLTDLTCKKNIKANVLTDAEKEAK